MRLSAYDVDLVTIVPGLVNKLNEEAPQMRLASQAKGGKGSFGRAVEGQARSRHWAVSRSAMRVRASQSVCSGIFGDQSPRRSSWTHMFH